MHGGAMALVPTLFPNLNEKESSMLLPSKVEHLTLKKCDLLDEYLVLVPSLLPNLKELNLDGCSSITVIPECTKECRFLRRLGLLVCKQLREIFEGILLNLTHLSVRYCPSLSSSCRSMLLRQELHEDVEINLELQGVRIPEWFEYKGGSPSLSFWFRNNFPRILLCTVASHYTPSHLTFFINGYSWDSFSVNWGHTLLSRLRERLEDRYIENEWNHAEFKWMKCMWNDSRIGIHVLKEQNMQDIRFTNPDKRRKVDLNLAPLEEDDVNTELTQ